MVSAVVAEDVVVVWMVERLVDRNSELLRAGHPLLVVTSLVLLLVVMEATRDVGEGAGGVGEEAVAAEE